MCTVCTECVCSFSASVRSMSVIFADYRLKSVLKRQKLCNLSGKGEIKASTKYHGRNHSILE